MRNASAKILLAFSKTAFYTELVLTRESHMTDQTTTPFTPGQAVYLDDGTKAHYFCAAPGAGHVVGLTLEGDFNGWDESFGPGGETAFVVNRVHAKAPVAQKAQEIVEAEIKLQALKDDLEGIRRAIREEEAAALERRKEMAKWDGLQTLEDFLAKRITHVVEMHYNGPHIRTFEDAIGYQDDRGRPEGMKLLSLFGRSNGDMAWRLNSYPDGSGNGPSAIIPATSLEKAKEIAVARLNAQWDVHRPLIANGAWSNGINYTIEAAQRLGLDLPEDIAAWWSAWQQRQTDKKVNNARVTLREEEARAAGLVVVRFKSLDDRHDADDMARIKRWGGDGWMDKMQDANLVVLERASGELIIIKDRCGDLTPEAPAT